MEKRIWTTKQILIGAILSGPLGGCFFLSRNYKIFGQNSHAKKALWIGLLMFLFCAFTLCFAPKGLGRMFPILIGVGVYEFAKRFQAPLIQEHLQEGHPKQSNWKLLGLSVLLFGGAAALSLGLALLLDLTFALM